MVIGCTQGVFKICGRAPTVIKDEITVCEVHLKEEMCSDLVNKCRQDALLVGVVGERVGGDYLTCTTLISFQLHSKLPPKQ